MYTNVVCTDFGWTIDRIVADLEQWYENLPKILHFQDISARSLPSEMERSIYLVHLFYFSSSILIFRRVTSESLRNPASVGSVPWAPCQERSVPTDGALLAASSSARMIKIMLDENRVFKRFWLIMLAYLIF